MNGKHFYTTVSLALGFFFILQPLVADESNMVWSLRIEDTRAYIEENRFDDARSFPLEDLRITRVYTHTTDANGNPYHSIRTERAQLVVDSNGMINGRDYADLVFVEEEIYGKVVDTGKALYRDFIDSEKTGLTAALKLGLGGLQAGTMAVAVFDRGGKPLVEKELERCSISDMYLDPEGKYLVYSKVKRRSQAETIIMDILSGQEKSLKSIPPETIRFYSLDGKRMAAVDTAGKVYFFDTTDHHNPVLLWQYEADDCITSGSVCDDGSLVAIQIQDKNYLPNTRTVVFNEEGEIVANPVPSGSQKMMIGTQWQGKHLVIGTQKHPFPRNAHLRSTDRIEIYDFTL